MSGDNTYDPFAIQDSFCEALVRVERVGSCRRLVFATTEHSGSGSPMRAVVVKLVLPAESMADIAQMIAADVAEPGAAFARMNIDAVKH